MRIPSFRTMVLGAVVLLPIGVGAFVLGISVSMDWLAGSGLLTTVLTLIGLATVLACHSGGQEFRRLLGPSLVIFFVAGAADLCFRLWDLGHPDWYYPSVHGISGLMLLAQLWRRRATLTPDGRVVGVILALLWLSFAVWLGSEDEEANNLFAVPLALAAASVADVLWRWVVPARLAANRLIKAGNYLVPLLVGVCIAVLLMLDEKNADDYLASGRAWRKKGDRDRALAHYTKAIRLNPNHYWAYSDRGQIWRAKGDNDRAIADFSEVIRIDPKDAYSYGNRGDAWWAKGDYDRAIADFTEAIRLFPGFHYFYAQRGNAWLDKRDYDRAITDLNEAIRLHPTYVWSYGVRGRAWRAKGDLDRAIADYGEAIRIDPKYVWAYVERGNAWRDKRDEDRAIADYSEVIRIDPQYKWAHANRGKAWLAKFDHDRAITDFNEAIRLDPKYVWAYNERGQAWGGKGDYDRAIADYGEAIRLDAKHQWAYANRGIAWRAKGDYDRAIADFSEAIRLDPKWVWAYASRGMAWELKGDTDRAIADFSEAIRLNPKYVWAYVNRGHAWRGKGDRENALADYNSAIRESPKSHGLHNDLAWTMAINGTFAADGKRAVELATRACQLTSWRNPYYLDTLAAAYAQAGNFEEAVRWQQKALQYREFVAADGKGAAERLALYRSKKPYRI